MALLDKLKDAARKRDEEAALRKAAKAAAEAEKARVKAEKAAAAAKAKSDAIAAAAKVKITALLTAVLTRLKPIIVEAIGNARTALVGAFKRLEDSAETSRTGALGFLGRQPFLIVAVAALVAAVFVRLVKPRTG